MRADVAIVGAGAAGLFAARALGEAGKQVLVLEARERLGGRIYPLSERVWGYPAQGGAEFVHGEAPLTKTLIKEAGATLTHAAEWWNVFDGEPTLHEWVSPHDTMLEGVLKSLKKDMPVAAFLDQYFPAPAHAALREIVLRRVEAYDAADPSRASALALLEDMTDEEGFMAANIREGYGALIEHLAAACRACGVEIRLGEEVAAIEAAPEQGTVALETAAGARYEARYALVTVPLPLILGIRTEPAAPEKARAIAQMGYGDVIKILLRFKEKWWAGARERNFEKLFFMFSNEAVPTWWTQYPEPHTTLTGWVAGPAATRLAKRPKDELIDLALGSLARIFAISREELANLLVVSEVFVWSEDPYARGAYSYYTPESADAIMALLEPIADSIFYAGEALYAGEAAGIVGGTVEAAFASGAAAAKAILALR